MIAFLALLPLALQAATPQVRLPLSPAGQATAKTFLGTPDPQSVALQQQLRAVSTKVRALAAQPKLDIAQLSVLVRQQQGLMAQMRRRSDDRMLTMLGRLSEADRLAFVRGMLAGPQPAGAGPR